ncbi:MAG: trypsin-like serine protease [Clostridia bacterium]|nr:trypsin-like serine protease [Clostridia bacterium]
MSENGNGFSNENGSASEYSYTRDSIPHPAYVDANYRVQPDKSAEKPGDSAEAGSGSGEGKKSGKKNGMGKFIAACLVCALLGGAAGGGIVWAVLPDSDSGTSSDGSSLNLSESAYSTEDDEVPVVDGSVLTASEIYALGCQQAVGISTEITYTNFLGMKTSAAVSGSGFIVTSDGYIVTNYHVIQDAYEGGYDVTVMLFSGDTYTAEIVGGDEDNDIAVLKIDATGLSAATIGSSDTLKVGDSVYAIGNPLGELSFSMTGGMVSALDRAISTYDDYGNATTNNMFQFDAALNEGNSGGPVYNNRGEVVGIATAKYEDTGVEGLGFAIPTDDISEMIDDLISKGYVSGKAYFGITVDHNYDTAAQYYKMVQGAYVSTVAEGSCCDKAGLQPDDIITAINDTEITSSTDLINAKRDYKAGETITLKVYRDSEYIELQVTLDEQLPDTETTTSSDGQQSETSGTILPVPKS